MSFVVYWLEYQADGGCVSKHEKFDDKSMSKAMSLMVELRKNTGSISHVDMASEQENMVGQMGVDSIVDGKTPDGHDYEWSKSGRAGRTRPKDLLVTHKKAEEQ